MSDLLTDTGAEFSPCRTWRYRLWRTWDTGRFPLVMLMLNPSTADEDKNDPTVERCERRARAGGFGGLIVLNIFAFRATDPRMMKVASDPVGPENDAYIRQVFAVSMLAQSGGLDGPMICAGWGSHGSHLGRDGHVQDLAREAGIQLHCLSVTKGGQPGHPLYIGYDTPFRPWIAP